MDILRNILASNLTDMAVTRFAKHFYKTIVKGRFPSSWCIPWSDKGRRLGLYDPKLEGGKAVAALMDCFVLRDSCPFTEEERGEFDRLFGNLPQTLVVVATSNDGGVTLAKYRYVSQGRLGLVPAITMFCGWCFEDRWLKVKDYKSAFVGSLSRSQFQKMSLAHEIVHFLDNFREDGSPDWRGSVESQPYRQRPREKNAYFIELVSGPMVVKAAMESPDFRSFYMGPYVFRHICRWGKGAYRQRLLSRLWEWWKSVRSERGLISA